ncbi:MAG: T9SS type A sorting domain-containing protein [Chitinophagales bacterium]|nr:T9SS type A sorting domain-containing protein [Chitinophagales bacterium]
MKTFSLLLLLSSFIFPQKMFAAWENRTMRMDNANRQYRIYTPLNYNPAKNYSLVVGIHGLGDNMTNFGNAFWEFQRIADSSDIILVFPQGVDNAIIGTGWNAGAGFLGIFPSENVNDVAFINAVTDSMQANFPIIKSQTYLFGFSNGGFMVQRIACEANERYAAIASIAGTIGVKITTCKPERTLPILHFHGTADVNVGYGVTLFGMNVENLLKVWIENNGCDKEPLKENIPDTKSDGYQIRKYTYLNCNERLVHFKVNNADHILLTKDKNDISYSEEMWNFFQPKRVPTAVKNLSAAEITIYPNPAKDDIRFDLQTVKNIENMDVNILDYSGRLVSKLPANNIGLYHYNTSNLPNGIYLLQVIGKSSAVVKKFQVIQ